MSSTPTDRLDEILDPASLSRLIEDHARSTLILFDAPWCTPARRIEERLLRLVPDETVKPVRLDVDRLPDLARRFGVAAVPTLLLFRHGQIAATRLGEVDDITLRHWIEDETAANAA